MRGAKVYYPVPKPIYKRAACCLRSIRIGSAKIRKQKLSGTPAPVTAAYSRSFFSGILRALCPAGEEVLVPAAALIEVSAKRPRAETLTESFSACSAR